jgi:hypothetical protein
MPFNDTLTITSPGENVGVVHLIFVELMYVPTETIPFLPPSSKLLENLHVIVLVLRKPLPLTYTCSFPNSEPVEGCKDVTLPGTYISNRNFPIS